MDDVEFLKKKVLDLEDSLERLHIKIDAIIEELDEVLEESE